MRTVKSNSNRHFWLDSLFSRYEWYRHWRKGKWYQHRFTKEANQLSFPQGKKWWTRHNKINKYSEVIRSEYYPKTK